MYKSRLTSRTMKIVVTIKTPSGRAASPVGAVAAWLKELINNRGKPRSSEENFLYSLGLTEDSTYRGYGCIKAEPYEEPAPSRPTTSVFGVIPLPPAVGTGPTISPDRGSTQATTGKIRGKLKVGASFVLGALITIVIERLGVPILHWIFSTLADYIK